MGENRIDVARVRKILDDFEKSGLSQAEFARRRGLASTTLNGWIKRVGLSEKRSSGFLPVVVQDNIAVGAREKITIRIGDHMAMDVPVGTSALWLQQILRGLSC